MLFYNNIAHLENPEDITKCEAKWLESAHTGGLIFGDKTSWIDGHNYDINSFYPANLLKFGIPFKSGEFQTLDKFPEFFTYGIYRCKIHHSGDRQIDRLFKLNDRNFYTHFDLEGAKMLNLKIELIHDGNPNYLCYTKKHIRGYDVFKSTIDYLFDLKQRGIPRAKELLSRLWGALCAKNKHHLNTKYHCDLPEDAEFESVVPVEDGNHVVEYTTLEKLYDNNFARVGPFLQAYGRYQMARLILPNNKYVVRAHTDSMLSIKPLNIDIGVDLGQFKLDKQGLCKVFNVCNVVYMNDVLQMFSAIEARIKA
jgi:hypothetical protein